jgi:hypothetical protein
MGVARTARGQPQSVRNSFHVTFETADGTRVASRNIDVSGTFTQADALLMRHDPKIRRGVQRQLAREATADERQRRGSPRWTRRERAGLRVTKVEREVQQRSTPWFFSRYDPGEIKRFRR